MVLEVLDSQKECCAMRRASEMGRRGEMQKPGGRRNWCFDPKCARQALVQTKEEGVPPSKPARKRYLRPRESPMDGCGIPPDGFAIGFPPFPRPTECFSC